MDHTNQLIDPEQLPRLTQIKYESLDKQYPNYITTGLLLTQLSILVAAAVLWLLIEQGILNMSLRLLDLIFWGVVCLVPIFIIWHGFARRKAMLKAFAIRQHDIIFKSGLFWVSESVQPLRRLQHVAMSQGPVEKYFGLASLMIYGAGTGRSTFTIPGLPKQRAEQIRQFALAYDAGHEATHEATHKVMPSMAAVQGVLDK